jgi:Transposase DDE domain group 1
MSTLRAEVLSGTELAVASVGQIRLRLFKITARLTVSVRRIHIELCSAYPLQGLFNLVHNRLVGKAEPIMRAAVRLSRLRENIARMIFLDGTFGRIVYDYVTKRRFSMRLPGFTAVATPTMGTDAIGPQERNWLRTASM